MYVFVKLFCSLLNYSFLQGEKEKVHERKFVKQVISELEIYLEKDVFAVFKNDFCVLLIL